MDEILAFAELERFANLKLKHYSSGMASRLAYAVAFQAVREVLVLDEIFAVGDAGFRASARSGTGSCDALGTRSMIVSHDPRDHRDVLRSRAAARRRPHRHGGQRERNSESVHRDAHVDESPVSPTPCLMSLSMSATQGWTLSAIAELACRPRD